MISVSHQIKRYLLINQCTLKDFSMQAQVSEAVVRKWLYYNQIPSRRMLGKLLALKNFLNAEDFHDPQWAEILKSYPDVIKDKQGGVEALAEIIAHRSKTFSVKKGEKDDIEISFTIDKRDFKAIDWAVDYSQIAQVLESHHYELSPEELEKYSKKM